MNDSGTVQILRKIVAEMGRDNICQNPHAFAGAILDMCDVGEVKLLTTVLRSHYSGRLMDYFRDGGSDAATWTQQKAFLINESGMSVENAESVLDTLWQALDRQRPKPAQPGPGPAKQAAPKVDPRYKKEYVDTSRLDVRPDEDTSRKVDPRYKKEYIDTSRVNASAGKPPRPAEQKAADRDDRDVRAGGAAEGAVRPQQQPQAQAQQEGSKWAPVLICAVWLFLAFKMSRDNGAGDILTRVQSGDYQLLLFVAAPIIAALFVCAKGAPKFLHGLGAVVLGIAAGYNFVVSLYWLDMSVLKMDLVFGSSTVGTILTVLISFIALFVAIAAGGECKKIGE